MKVIAEQRGILHVDVVDVIVLSGHLLLCGLDGGVILRAAAAHGAEDEGQLQVGLVARLRIDGLAHVGDHRLEIGIVGTGS